MNCASFCLGADLCLCAGFLRSYMVGPPCDEVRPILVILSAEQFCISHSEGDDRIRADASGRCTVSWNKYEDMGKAWLGGSVYEYRFICTHDPAVPWTHWLYSLANPLFSV